MEGFSNERFDFGRMGYGCQHYRRRCLIRAPCCNEIFPCRHCHNEATNMLRNPMDRHELDRHDVKQVVCAVCDTEQPVSSDGDKERSVWLLLSCSVTVFGSKNVVTNVWLPVKFRLIKCSFTVMIAGFAGSCYSVALRDNHLCIENSMRHHCPICYEYLFDSLKNTTVLTCGHTMHSDCCQEMLKRDKYCCPICSKSVIDMSRTWKRLDEEIEATTMPEEYRSKKVWILCNDCNDTTEVYFHILGQKCSHCKSYNTCQIAPPVLP
uniref:Uncharacterized protein n=1 Tax=Chenopodium quinoa TaxID=63459 RepID=A0A803NBK9_CHEQI